MLKLVRGHCFDYPPALGCPQTRPNHNGVAHAKHHTIKLTLEMGQFSKKQESPSNPPKDPQSTGAGPIRNFLCFNPYQESRFKMNNRFFLFLLLQSFLSMKPTRCAQLQEHLSVPYRRCCLVHETTHKSQLDLQGQFVEMLFDTNYSDSWELPHIPICHTCRR